MQGQATRKNTQWQITKDADSIPLEPIRVDRYSEFSNDIDKAGLVAVISDEAEAFRQQKLHDLQELETEFQTLGGFLQAMQQQDNQLAAHAQEISNAQAAYRQEFEAKQQRVSSYEETIKEDREKIRDLKQMLTTMVEQLSKEVKKCDKEALQAVRKNLSSPQASAVGRQVLEKICQIVSKSESATYQVEGLDLFCNEAVLSSAVKKCDPAEMKKEYLSKLAAEITIDQEGQRGKVLSALLNTENVAFFPFYKVLFKLNQIGLTKRNWVSIKKSIEGTEKTIKEAKISMEQTKDLMEGLNFQEKIQEEINRSRQTECQTILAKYNELDARIKQGQFVRDPNMFARWYYEGL